jgi:exodeoxyribonuclease V beta subunit
VTSERARPLTCRTFAGHIDERWRIASFSSLVAAQPVTAELADDDRVSLFDYHDRAGDPDDSGGGDVTDIFSFPRGTKAGTFFHEVLETIDFTTADAGTTREIVEEKLNAYRFDIRWCGVVGDVVSQVRSVPLTTVDGRLTLSEISRDDRLNELEFYFPLREITPEKLRRTFAPYAGTIPQADFPERIGRLRFSPASGYMRGFIDMVFRHGDRYYLVDWKLNYLGSGIDDYHRDALAGPMREHYYMFQYYIYTVALNRYLQARLPGYDYDRNFGGVYYLFLRGVDAAGGEEYGVYRDRPSKALVDDLCRTLEGRGA